MFCAVIDKKNQFLYVVKKFVFNLILNKKEDY